MTSPQYQPAPPAQGGTGETPLWAPLYGASLPQAFQRFFKKYADFSGRASRSEYWWWYLVSFLVTIALELLALALGGRGTFVNADGASTPGPLFWLPSLLILVWTFGTLVPYLSLTWRRLHDANLPGPLFFLGFIPFVLLILTLLPSKPEGARFDRPRA